ncbi:hypothetical protein [Thalassotalea fusca]
MDILNQLVMQEEDKQKSKSKFPAWVSDENISKRAFIEINKQFEEKSKYIKRHSKKEDFTAKKNWQIFMSHIARNLESDSSTIFDNETFKVGINKYFEDKNEELNNKKEAKLKKNGLPNQNKDQLIETVRDYKKEFEALEQRKNKELLTLMIELMPLPDRRKLNLI